VRQKLLTVLERALAAVHGRGRVREALLAMGFAGPCHAVAIGKAASAMTLGALDVLGDSLKQALVISRDDHFDAALLNRPVVTCHAAGHPIPDERSLEAGRKLLEFLRGVPPAQGLLFLISGGASSLVEVLPEGVSLGDLGRVNQWVLSSGCDIRATNAIRRRLSLLKNGGLLSNLSGREALALYISDVPGDEPALIGSGMLAAPSADPLPTDLPTWIMKLVPKASLVTRPPGKVAAHVIATLNDATDAAVRAGESLGLEVLCERARFSGDAVELAIRFCHELATGGPALHVWGGESTVRLPRKPGRGGRNQHLALSAARLLVAHEDLMLLAVGTDGTDGSTTDAGALVDSQTVERGTLAGLDADACLRRADSAAFLEASGDLLHTGPTGTNVGDLVLGLKRM
jgi:hydroxypyruvate reductase